MQGNAYAAILVTLDGSEVAEQVFSHVVPIAARFGSRLILLQVTTTAAAMAQMALDPTATVSTAVVAPELFEAEKERVAEYLAGAAARLRAQGLASVDFEHPDGAPAETIVRRARELGVSLIAMTTHGRGGLGRLVFGSVADSVLRDAPCPVLLVRVTDAQPA